MQVRRTCSVSATSASSPASRLSSLDLSRPLSLEGGLGGSGLLVCALWYPFSRASKLLSMSSTSGSAAFGLAAGGSCLGGGMVADRPLLALLIDVEPSSSELAASSMAVGWKLPIILEGDGLEAGAAALRSKRKCFCRSVLERQSSHSH